MQAKHYIMIYNFLSVVIIFCLIFWTSVWWSTKKQVFNSPTIVFNGAKIFNNKHYFEFVHNKSTDNKKVNIAQYKKILLEHPFIQVFRTSNRYPDQIIIDIKEREPFAIINKEPMVLLDKNGYVMPYNENSKHFNVPILSKFNTAPELYPEGEKTLSVKVIDIISWLKLLNINYPELYSEISEITLTNEDEINLILANQATKVILGNKDTLEKLKILQKFKELVIKKNKLLDIAYLDMRYENQIIVKEN